MSTCSTGVPGCSITCAHGCGAIYFHTTHVCCTWCHPDEPDCDSKGPYRPNIKVSFSAQDVPLIGVAKFLDRLFPNQIAVPAALAESQVNLQMTEVTLGEVVRELGLVVVRA